MQKLLGQLTDVLEPSAAPAGEDVAAAGSLITALAAEPAVSDTEDTIAAAEHPILRKAQEASFAGRRRLQDNTLATLSSQHLAARITDAARCPQLSARLAAVLAAAAAEAFCSAGLLCSEHGELLCSLWSLHTIVADSRWAISRLVGAGTLKCAFWQLESHLRCVCTGTAAWSGSRRHCLCSKRPHAACCARSRVCKRSAPLHRAPCSPHLLLSASARLTYESLVPSAIRIAGAPCGLLLHVAGLCISHISRDPAVDALSSRRGTRQICKIALQREPRYPRRSERHHPSNAR